MGVDLPMGADFKERDLEEGLYLFIVFRHPFSGHEEGGGDLLLNQIVDQCLIVARSFRTGQRSNVNATPGQEGGPDLITWACVKGGIAGTSSIVRAQAQYPEE